MFVKIMTLTNKSAKLTDMNDKTFLHRNSYFNCELKPSLLKIAIFYKGDGIAIV